MDMPAQEVDQGLTLEQRLEKIKIKGILEKSKQAQRLIEEIVRYGCSVSPKTIMTELVYQHLKIPKDEDNLGMYKDDQIRIEDSCLYSKDIFSQTFRQVDIGILQNAGNDLIEWAFGEGIVDFFHYAQERLNSTGFQRIGGEQLKNAYIFIHSVRVLERMNTTYERQLALVHDVVEDVTKFRDDERKRLEKEQNSVHERALQVKLRQRGIEALIQDYNRDIDMHREMIKNPPEREYIKKLFEDNFAREYKDNKKANILAIAALNHLDLLTRKITPKGKEDYEAYIMRLEESVDSEGIQRLLKSVGIEREEAKQFYETPIVVKLTDTLDNTERSREIDILRNYNRLEHNLILLKMVDRFIEKHNIKKGKLVDRKNKLYDLSMTELNFNIDTRYSKDPNPHVQDYLRRLSELRGTYREIPKAIGGSSGIFRNFLSFTI